MNLPRQNLPHIHRMWIETTVSRLIYSSNKNLKESHMIRGLIALIFNFSPPNTPRRGWKENISKPIITGKSLTVTIAI